MLDPYNENHRKPVTDPLFRPPIPTSQDLPITCFRHMTPNN